MTIAAGTRFGPYEVVAPLGEGGMGVVYRARDVRLGRDVAVKVLPASFAADPERLRRFEQEARAAGQLNHPNLLVIHDAGTHDGCPYLTSELLEGETLRARMDDSALPTRKAADYALQIAHGLAAAHERGIVHRDLKPENIFITADGRAKILDFGLAKLVERAEGNESGADAPTRKLGTDPGAVMGTVGYMSPEQARGRPVDQRTDIFSFGVVLYEMLSGRRAFRGESAVETLNAIIKDDPPDINASNAAVPPALERLVRRCIEKNPAERFQSARDLAFALEAVSGTGADSGRSEAAVVAAPPARAKWRARLPWAVAAAFALAAVAAFALPYFRRAPDETRAARFPVAIPDGAYPYTDVEVHNMGVSPDGRYLAFVAYAGGQRAVWVRPLDAMAATSLPGTEGANSIFWSPDSRHVAFFADGKLRRVEVAGKSLQTVCSLSALTDATGTWGRDGTIVFSEENSGGIYRVSAAGGAPSLLVEGKGHSRRWVHFLPDGRRFLFYKGNEGENNRGIYAGSLDSGEIRQVTPMPPARMQYVKDGHLLYPREGSLVAHPFDEKNLRLTGEPVVVVERLPFFDKTGWAEFSASEGGALAHAAESPKTRLVWLDRGGRETGQPGEPGKIYFVRLSPDGQRAALTMEDAGGSSGGDLWIQDLARGTRTRFVSGPTDDGDGVWSPDGRRLAYFSCCEAASPFHVKELGDTGKGQLPVKEQSWAGPVDWSRDGRFILYWAVDDLWVLPVAGGEKPYLWMQPRPHVYYARFSPDGRWVAFASEETGRPEVYVTRFDRPGERSRVSTEGGDRPRWRGDGKELFYVTPDNKVMAVQINSGETFDAGPPAPLFRVDPLPADYDVAADGQRFLFVASAPGTQLLPFAVVLNWEADLKRRPE